ncbi:MAG: hypothetical protein U0835_23100 [Isosphaeraceae bacterium]
MSRRLGKARSILRHRLSHYVLPLALLALVVGCSAGALGAWRAGPNVTDDRRDRTDRPGVARRRSARVLVPAEAIRIAAAFLQHGEVDGHADAPALPQPASRELRLAAGS